MGAISPRFRPDFSQKWRPYVCRTPHFSTGRVVNSVIRRACQFSRGRLPACKVIIQPRYIASRQTPLFLDGVSRSRSSSPIVLTQRRQIVNGHGESPHRAAPRRRSVTPAPPLDPCGETRRARRRTAASNARVLRPNAGRRRTGGARRQGHRHSRKVARGCESTPEVARPERPRIVSSPVARINATLLAR